MMGGPCDRSRDARLDLVEKGGPGSPIPHQGEEQLARLRICLAESDKADLRPGSSRQIQSLVVDVPDTLLAPQSPLDWPETDLAWDHRRDVCPLQQLKGSVSKEDS